MPSDKKLNWSFAPNFIIRGTGFPFELVESLKMHELRSWLKKTTSAVASDHDNLCKDNSMGNMLFEKEWLLARERFYQIIQRSDFQEAVFLSSPDMYENSLLSALRKWSPNHRSSNVRRIERKLYLYLQRFCTKNDTTSFFGPLDYGRFWVDEMVGIDLNQGEQRVTERKVYLAHWAVRKLAELMNSDQDINHSLPIRLMPSYSPVLSPAHKTYFGINSRFRNIVKGILSLLERGSYNTNELKRDLDYPDKDIDAVLQNLIDNEVIIRNFALSNSDVDTLEFLESQITKLKAPIQKIESWGLILSMFRKLCFSFTFADLQERRQILTELESLFHQLTGINPRRNPGVLYGDRLIIYEECRGSITKFNVSKQISENWLTKLEGTLKLASVIGDRIWRACQLHSIEQMKTHWPGAECVPLAEFIEKTAADSNLDSLHLHPNPLHEVIENSNDVKSVSLNSADFPEIRQAHPFQFGIIDLLIEADSKESFLRGEGTLVLGGVHSQFLIPSWMTVFHPQIEEIQLPFFELQSFCSGKSEIVAFELRRRNKAFYKFVGKKIEIFDCGNQTASNIPIRDVYVTVIENQLQMFSGSGDNLFLYPTLVDFEGDTRFVALGLPPMRWSIAGTTRHTPRVVLDNVVIQREQWVEELPKLSGLSGFPLMLELWKFAEKIELPPQVFVHIKGHRKPFFVDFENYISLESLAHLTINHRHVVFTEFLPSSDGLWRVNDEKRFCTELRIGVLHSSGNEFSWMV